MPVCDGPFKHLSLWLHHSRVSDVTHATVPSMNAQGNKTWPFDQFKALFHWLFDIISTTINYYSTHTHTDTEFTASWHGYINTRKQTHTYTGVRNISFLCIRIHTGVGHTNNESAQHFWLWKSLANFSRAPYRVQTLGLWISSLTFYQLSHPIASPNLA